MKQFLLISCLIILVFSSCKNQANSNNSSKNIKQQNTLEITGSNKSDLSSRDYKQESPSADTDNIKTSKSINFFGVKLQGTYEEIIKNIYTLPILSLIERRDTIMQQENGEYHFSHTVEFCGIPCGMNADFPSIDNNLIAINNLTFITSLTDDIIIDKFVSKLKTYYGEPSISDDIEDSYHWHLPDGLYIRARHFRASEGGWTVFFYFN